MADDTLSILGLYYYDKHIFDSLELPKNASREVAVDAILMECAELEILFPDPKVMSYMIGAWSKTRIAAWEKIWTALSVDYNVLDNVDITRTYTTSQKRTGQELENTNALLNSHSATTSNGTTTHSEASFNEGQRVTSSDTVNQTVTSGADQTTKGDANRNSTENVETTHTETEVGDSSVRSTQYMLTEELKLRTTDFYQILVEEFRNKFCLEVY